MTQSMTMTPWLSLRRWPELQLCLPVWAKAQNPWNQRKTPVTATPQLETKTRKPRATLICRLMQAWATVFNIYLTLFRALLFFKNTIRFQFGSQQHVRDKVLKIIYLRIIGQLKAVRTAVLFVLKNSSLVDSSWRYRSPKKTSCTVFHCTRQTPHRSSQILWRPLALIKDVSTWLRSKVLHRPAVAPPEDDSNASAPVAQPETKPPLSELRQLTVEAKSDGDEAQDGTSG